MKFISMLRLAAISAFGFSLIAMSTCLQQSVSADVICSIETVTGFANEAGGFDSTDNPPAGFTIELTGLGTDALAGGFIELMTFGDFSIAAEYIEISIEGDALGILWDNDTTNDEFVGNNADNDRGQEYGQGFGTEVTNESAVAQLTESQLDDYLADGVLTINFEMFGAEVNNLVRDDDEFITAKVTINQANAIPEPSVWLIAVLTGMIGTALRRRKCASPLVPTANQ